MTQTVLLFSGGLDSTVALFELLRAKEKVATLSVLYGQRHQKELDYARSMAADLGILHRVADLSNLKPFLLGNSQTDNSVEVPEGHYTEDTMKQTVVPNRNMVMLSVAAAWALSLKYDAVAYAAHTGDHAIYPDCRKEFIQAMKEAIRLCDWHSIELKTPFDSVSKTDIVKRGHELGVPFEKTWSCYKGLELHCGKCGTCTERKEAFAEAGVADPTEYAQ